MLEKIIKQYRNDIRGIVQVGSNTGQEVELFIKYNIKKISLFEPLKDAFERLASNPKFKNINLYNFALGNSNEEAKLNVADKNFGASSSILNPTLHNSLFPEIKFNQKEDILIKKFSSLGISGHNFMVIDTQGYELRVLEGFEEKLNDFTYIYTEISRKSLYENDVLVSDLDNFLKKKRIYKS